MSRLTRFRACHESDLWDCAGIGAHAFPLIAGKFEGDEAGKAMKGQVDSCHAVSNYHEIAVVGGGVAGFLFGRIKRKRFLADVSPTLKRLVLISVRFMLGKYGSRRKLLRFLSPCLEELRAIRRNRPACEAEIVLFAVATQYQGTGIGRALMERFVDYARRYEAKSVCVPTDETAGFGFYERYGFRRWAEFEAPLESYCAGRSVKGFIYRLLLPRAIDKTMVPADEVQG